MMLRHGRLRSCGPSLLPLAPSPTNSNGALTPISNLVYTDRPPEAAASMTEVLGSVARINDELGHGTRDEEMRAIAEAAGMDPRGVAGYYNAGLLEKRSDGTRWILPAGRERLERLAALQNVHLLASDG